MNHLEILIKKAWGRVENSVFLLFLSFRIFFFNSLMRFKNFPQFVVIHTVKGFGIANEAEVDVFLEFSCFFYDPADVGNLISGSAAFSKPRMNIWKFSVLHTTENLAWRILSITCLECEMSAIVL